MKRKLETEKPMTVNELTDQELSLWIAEKALRWVRMTYGQVFRIEQPQRCTEEYAFDERPTPYWHDPVSAKVVGFAEDVNDYYDPTEKTDMVNDAEMTVMLMQRESFVDVLLDEGVYTAHFCGHDKHSEDCADFHRAQSKRLGRVVAESFAKAHGWTS